MAEIDSDMNLIMNMLLTKLTVKQTLLEDRDKQLVKERIEGGANEKAV